MKTLLQVLALFCLMSLQTAAQAPRKTFRGTELSHQLGSGSGIFVSATSGSRGEILRIRAPDGSANKLLKTKLPAGFPNSLVLQVKEITNKTTNCNGFGEEKFELENCFSTKPISKSSQFDVVFAGEIGSNSPPLNRFIMRINDNQKIYMTCFTEGRLRVIGPYHCNSMSFEQGGLWHELEIFVSRTPDELRQLRCAALELRNAVWPAGAEFSNLCSR